MTAEPQDNEKSARRPPPLLISAAAALGVLLATILIIRSCGKDPVSVGKPTFHTVGTVTPENLASFAGSEACSPCHSDIYAKHRDSHHAHALSFVDVESQASRFKIGNPITDPKRALQFKTAVDGDRCIQSVDHEDHSSSIAARYAVGSGKNAVTYLADYDDRWLELRLSFYSKAGRWDFSPGQQVDSIGGGILYPDGLVKAPGVVGGCFICHSTAVPQVLGHLQPEKGILGVGCESCHGPGRDHIAAVQRKDTNLRMTRLSTLRNRVTVELCGQCHRSPVSEDINDAFNKSQMPRLQGLALTQSACFTKSAGQLSCLTCHSPHGNAEKPRVEYNRDCLGCHAGAEARGARGEGTAPEPSTISVKSPTQRPCSLEPRGDCVSCHMPAQTVGMPTGLKYRTHWIKVWGLR